MSRRTSSPPLSPERARRQFEATRMAIAFLGPEAAIEFMNDKSDALDARPIDLALASEKGRTLVEAELRRMQRNEVSGPK